MKTTTRHRYLPVKRFLDVLGALICLILLSPIILITAIVVAVGLGRPIIFRQPRPGLNEKMFVLYKFRTMKSVDVARGLVTDEQRLTKLGKFLRSTSLDELPSLWNVLTGDMSFVGPRPLLVEYLDRYSSEQARRHEVRPGITGLAQVNGRNHLEWDNKFKLDIEYVDNVSMKLDFMILLKTITVVSKASGINHLDAANSIYLGSKNEQ